MSGIFIEKCLKMYSIAQFTFQIKLVNARNTSIDICPFLLSKENISIIFMEVPKCKVTNGKKTKATRDSLGV